MKYIITFLFCIITLLASAQVKQEYDIRAYSVKLYLVHFLPTVNPALLRWETTVFYHKYPTGLEDIEKLVVLPQFIKRRNYRICKDCPLEIMLISK
jgi:hypothetical protein